MAKPLNVSPVLRVFFAVMPKINAALANKHVTVTEAIDLAADLAKKTASEMGISDNVIAVTEDYQADEK